MPSTAGRTINGFIVFTDISGFSKVPEQHRQETYRQFYQQILPPLSKDLAPYKGDMVAFNTWGDGLMAAFQDIEAAIHFMFAYRDFFPRTLTVVGTQEAPLMLKPRIAAHAGHFEIYDDPLLETVNITGEGVIRAARTEPVTRVGEIFVTQAFYDTAYHHSQTLTDFAFDEQGEFPLAKGFGRSKLYRLRRESEDPHLIDTILTQDLSKDLPRPTEITQEEQEWVNSLNAIGPLEKLLSDNFHLDEERSGPYLLKISELCMSFGLYERAVDLLNRIESLSLPVDHMRILSYVCDVRVMRIRTNCLTQLGRYEEAANIAYRAWRHLEAASFGDQPGKELLKQQSDVLSMLAAQYKRRALIGEDGAVLPPEERNWGLLQRALNLYVEAFRRNVNDYYPAINAAYLYKMIDGEHVGNGNRLAQHIVAVWGKTEPENWWQATTVCEAYMLFEDFEKAIPLLKTALDVHHPLWFERASTRQQIEIYSAVSGRHSAQFDRIIDMLQPQ